MADSNAALIAFLGVLVGGYFNNFLAEDFRRFRDSQALAGALAGELKSHAEAIPDIKHGLTQIHAIAETGALLTLPEWPEPGSPVFEANVGQIGLLDPELAKDVAYVYENLRAFRGAFHQLSKHHEEMNAGWRVAMVKACADRIKSAETVGVPLVEKLKHHAAASYWRRPETRHQGITVLLFVAAFMFGANLHHTGSSESKTDCTATDDHGVLHMVCK
ncbi:hypothetical protein [Paraburkholderia lacunae]|uniref:Uncharacterized protein n=1 Tax=Paraburkholderia lacunae TaxID=2211104 RepID=A0A370NFU1_9BURK|nr:hypothetical protein [Paraburkholderia lacunae]RDK04477.1 hypothetical protein DLM46_00960 [Paraburkholderia lacunae]